MKRESLSLGVNLDHVATLRQARGEDFPSPALAAREAEAAGADGITLHLREDRRHIQDSDLPAVRKACSLPINLEMALHPRIIQAALRFKPEKVCIVPERRQELTTEGGLDVIWHEIAIKRTVQRMHKKKIQVSLFIAPNERQVRAAKSTGADAVELHTGTYANAAAKNKPKELERIRKAAALASVLGLKVHAGHGIDYDNVKPIAAIPEIEELNIGFSIVGRAIFIGMREAVREMKELMQQES